MTAKVVLASRRFQRDYPQFLRKYTALEATFRQFLDFRANARPDQSFNAKDGRMPGIKFWRCHLIHGKAILIYQLHGSEIRLVAIDDHDSVEGGGTSTTMRNYARSLTPDDYYQFNIDAPVAKPVLEPELAGIITMEATSPEHDPVIVESSQPANPIWDDKLVHYLRDQQMLYNPRPAHPLIVLHLTKELIAPKGDVLVIDTVTQAIHHLTAAELNAHFQPDARPASSLAEAIKHVLPQAADPAITAAPPSPTPVVTTDATVATRAEQPTEQPTVAEQPIVAGQPTVAGQPGTRATGRQHNVGPQLGRLVVIFASLQREYQTNKFDTATIAAHMPVGDRKAVSGLMVNAQNAGLIRKSGKKVPGPGYVYSLTATGERTGKALGDWPFASVGLSVPTSQQVAAE